MAEEDLKPGTDVPAGNDRPAETPASPPAVADSKVPPAEEMVSISKSELDKLTEEKEAYRKATIRLNRQKGRSLPDSEPDTRQKSNEEGSDDDNGFLYGGQDDSSGVASKGDLKKRDEQLAIDLACEDSVVDEHYEEIMGFWERPREGGVRALRKSILEARDKWVKFNPPAKPADTHKQIASTLAADSGNSKGKERTNQPVEKKHIIPQKAQMKDWY